MPELGRFSRELRSRLWKPSVHEEVSDEVRAHLEMIEQELIAQGTNPDEARVQARQRFGNVARIEAECRTIGERRDVERRRSEWTRELGQDLRYALRQLRSAPRFALVAIVTLAVGLGASTTIFGIASAVLLRPLPYVAPDRLVGLLETTPEGQRYSVSEANYLDWTARARAFASLAAISGGPVTLTGSGDPEQVRGATVTHTLFPTLGVLPLIGRGFRAEEDRAGGDTLVAMISDRLWQRRYGADPRVIEQRIDINGVAHRVVGVIPFERGFPSDVDVWTPLSPSPDYPRGDRRLDVVARLRDGVSREQAAEEMAVIARELSAAYPRANENWSVSIAPLREWFVSPQLAARVLALLATVGMLLLMACVNVANLLLSRAAVRERELAVRAALGAGRSRIIRQLLTESFVLSAIGAVAGILVAMGAVPVLRRIGGEVVPRLAEMTIDWRVVSLAVPVCLFTGLVFGSAPALLLARVGGSGAIARDSFRSGTRLAPSGRARNILIVMSVALATVMLTSAALVGKSFLRLMQSELGFSPDGVFIANVSLAGDRYDSERAIEFMTSLRERIATQSGVRAVGAINIPPFGRGNTSQGFIRAELANDTREGYRMGSWRVVTPGYFEALGIPLLRGRAFTDDDRAGGEVAVVINETLAKQAFGDEDPLGRRLASSNGQVKTVIGVVRDTRHLYLDSLPAPTMYWAHSQFPWGTMWLTVRTLGDPSAMLPIVQREVRALDPLIAVANPRALRDLVDNRSAEPRLTAMIFGIFATAALTLAAVGLYGIVSYSTSQRTREIGVSLALGARPRRIVARVLRDGLRLTLGGVALGLVGAWAGTRLLRSLLYETTPTDVWTLLAVALGLLLVGALASALPARRASRLDPIVALRWD